tara:strand:+ start:81 stop:722 length:642 start_codon:yes stop_codon:yes gene_type:complete
MRDTHLPCDSPRIIHGQTLRTWTYQTSTIDQVKVVVKTEGRPFDADIELWSGPYNTPAKIRVYSENGKEYGFKTIIQTPHDPNTIAIRNIGAPEFPFSASVSAKEINLPSEKCFSQKCQHQIQGGAIRTYAFEPQVVRAEIMLKTIGQPLNARIELIQGPNTNKQTIELYSEDGFERPFFCYLQTPNAGSVLRIVNTAPVEFPLIVGCAYYKE